MQYVARLIFDPEDGSVPQAKISHRGRKKVNLSLNLSNEALQNEGLCGTLAFPETSWFSYNISEFSEFVGFWTLSIFQCTIF
jgi:hypothetical protein